MWLLYNSVKLSSMNTCDCLLAISKILIILWFEIREQGEESECFLHLPQKYLATCLNYYFHFFLIDCKCVWKSMWLLLALPKTFISKKTKCIGMYENLLWGAWRCVKMNVEAPQTQKLHGKWLNRKKSLVASLQAYAPNLLILWGESEWKFI